MVVGLLKILAMHQVVILLIQKVKIINVVMVISQNWLFFLFILLSILLLVKVV